MSLNPVTSGLGQGLPVKKVQSTATDNVQSIAKDPVKHVNKTTQPLTEPVLPGQFPSDDAPKDDKKPQPEIQFSAIWTSFSQWLYGLFPRSVDSFEWIVKWLVDRYFPPPKQAQMYEAALSRPIASTFLVCQAICCGVPLLVFLVGVFIFAAVSLLLWAVLSLLILGPVLLVASMMGISLWGWGWILYGLVKWVDQRFLGGMITRFWGLPQAQEGDGQEERDGDSADGADEGEVGEKKDN
ncbi:hypothetical protein N7533_007123 [Penicillium manginii]|jgi:hypothetical protein|uniref:uncharacterized protein n=1 Tax=Penicillium manginii TaxID=203109 RepID=UPI0025499F86|nr:uncharacterized protein N7533_007123 [Penicillium manginii]KAJ5750095.1 hypothetical protein N7533_007123 [Penicillium manginii]